MEIADSARKHGISDEDILHATRNLIAVLAVQDDRILYAAAAQDGNLLEEPAVIHANVPKWHPYL